MAVGYDLTKGTVDNRAGALAVRLRDTLRQCREFDAWLDTQVNTDLEALGYSSTEVAQLKSAFADAALLADVYEGVDGAGTTAEDKDFRTFLNLLIGPR